MASDGKSSDGRTSDGKTNKKLERYLDTSDGRYKLRLVGGRKPLARFWPSENMKRAAHSRMRRQGLKNSLENKKAMRRYYQGRADQGRLKSPTTEELLLHGVDPTSWDKGDGTFLWQSPDISLLEAKKLHVEIPAVGDATDTRPEVDNEEMEKMVVILNDMVATPKHENPEFETQALRNLAAKGDISKHVEPEIEKPAPTGRLWKGEKVDKRFTTKITWRDPEPSARTDLYAWYNSFILNEDNYGEDFIPLGKIHEEWCMRVTLGKKIVMLCPRDHYKTSLLNVGYILYHICELQDKIATKGILNVSLDSDLAEETYGIIQKNLMENPRILSFYGYLIDDKRPKTQKKMYFLFQPLGSRPGLFCTSLKSRRITGTHPYIVFMDDIEDEELSETDMKKFQNIIDKKLIPALGKKGRIIITGTLKGWNADNDAYLWLQTKRTFQVYFYPAVKDGKLPPIKTDVKYEVINVPIVNDRNEPMYDLDGQPLYDKVFKVTHIKDAEQYETIYPERYNIYDIVEKKLELRDKDGNDDVFNSEYMLKPTDPTGRYFKYERVEDFEKGGYGSPMEFVDYTYKRHKHRYLWIDPGGAGDQAHGIAVSVMSYIDGKYFLLDFRVIRKPVPEAGKDIADMIIHWKVDKWGCEGNFDQKENYGNQLKEVVRKILEKQGKSNLYSTPFIRSNTGNKMKRISTHMSIICGPEDSPVQVFVNRDSEGYDDFYDQYGYFGKMINNQNHDFDVLDSIASTRIHLLGSSRPYGCAKA